MCDVLLVCEDQDMRLTDSLQISHTVESPLDQRPMVPAGSNALILSPPWLVVTVITVLAKDAAGEDDP